LGDVGIGGRIILKWTLKKQCVTMWIDYSGSWQKQWQLSGQSNETYEAICNVAVDEPAKQLFLESSTHFLFCLAESESWGFIRNPLLLLWEERCKTSTHHFLRTLIWLLFLLGLVRNW
jgi:hypothetical protein